MSVLQRVGIRWWQKVPAVIFISVPRSALKENLVNGNLSPHSDLRQIVRDRLGLQIGPEMTHYLAAKTAESIQPIPIIGQDARTGIPRRQSVDPQLLRMEPS